MFVALPASYSISQGASCWDEYPIDSRHHMANIRVLAMTHADNRSVNWQIGFAIVFNLFVLVFLIDSFLVHSGWKRHKLAVQ